MEHIVLTSPRHCPKTAGHMVIHQYQEAFLFSELLERDWLSLGKVRLNYAEVGNDAPFASVLDTYVPVAPFTEIRWLSVANTKNNPDLKPERTKSIEAGLEMNFL